MTTKEETAPQQFIFDKEHFPNYDSWHPYIGIQARLSLWALRTNQEKNWRLRANSGEGYSWKSLINILNSDEESKESEKEREEKKEKKQFIIDSWSEILYRGHVKASKQKLIDIFTDFATRKRINDDKNGSIREMVRATEQAREQETKERDAARAAERTTVKGTCIFCGKDVLSTERRLRDRNGDYVHSKCAAQKSQVSQPESLQKKVHVHRGGRRKTKKRRRKRKTKRKKRKTKRKKRKTKKRRRKRKTKRR